VSGGTVAFENRGPEVGATITHPHGQIYAFEFVPELPLRELRRGTRFAEPGERMAAAAGDWRARVPRYVAAGELGFGVYFNPIAPEEAARALREAGSTTRTSTRAGREGSASERKSRTAPA